MNGDAVHPHSIFIDDCRRAELTGICEVENFNDTGIDLLSHHGTIAIEGEDLRIDSFSVDTGKISVDGKITGVFYYEKQDRAAAKRSGLFTRHKK